MTDRIQDNLPACPPNTWVATVVYANGRRANLPVALRTSEGERPYPGAQWIFPPTLVNPEETIVGENAQRPEPRSHRNRSRFSSH